MPLVTSPPVEVSITARQSQSGINPFLFAVGLNLYLAFINVIPGANRISIFRSTDNGSTWVEQDSVNSPDQGSIATSLSCFQEPSTGNIDVLYIGPSARWKIVQFNTTTNTYGSPTVGAIGSAFPFNFFYRQSGGDFVVVYGSGSNISYRVNSGGVWAAAVATALPQGTVLGGILDSTDRGHFCYRKASGGAFYANLDATLTASAETSLGTTTGLDGFDFLIDSGTLYFAQISDDVQSVIFHSGTPLAAPVFTTITVSTVTGSAAVDYPALALDNTGAITLFWVETDYGVSPFIDQVWFAAFNGVSFGVPAVFYDEITNPPADSVPNQLNQFVHTLGAAAQTPGGLWIVATALETRNAGIDNCSGFILLGQAASPVSLACPANSAGIVGTPFSSSLIVSGGTAPYTYSLSGGSLPPGLSLDPSTGVISGTPLSSGTFSYTVQVTDSASSTASVTCSISVALVQAQGGRGFARFSLNAFDGCLGREFRMYDRIDRQLLACGVKPAGFLIDEREWGVSNDDDEMPPGAPAGSISFNPSNQLTLPTAISGDNVIFQFTVPVGYDGIILGQFHGYYRRPIGPIIPPQFIEGSGDIIWRISANDRFLRDCGAMLVSLGSIRAQAPIAGGLQLRSQDIVKYIVAAPNLSGTLSAGQGAIIAGVHGYFWPRK